MTHSVQLYQIMLSVRYKLTGSMTFFVPKTFIFKVSFQLFK